MVNKEEKKEEEGLGVPPVGVGQVSDLTLQVLVAAAGRPLSAGFPLLSLTRGH
ncbi:MAG: hypothetical protein LBI58_02630 [Tannerellaceae bacterium]|nr:hypothetical protein [Tannerellaceae bacterium]